MTLFFKDHPVKAMLFMAAILLMFGLRFSDGGSLMMVAKGEPVTSAAFANPNSQYLWDSPLKIAALRLLGPHLVLVSLFALVLSIFIPVIALVSRSRLAGLLTLALLFTPILKLMLQNVGVGDGVTIVAGVLLLTTERRVALVAATAVLCLWHPQQSFFVIGSVFLARTFQTGRVLDASRVAIALTAVAAAIVYGVYRVEVVPHFVDRATWVLSVIRSSVLPHLLYSPYVLAPVVAWGLVFLPRVAPGWRLATCLWFALCFVIAMITTDVTRVMTIVTLPLLLAITHKVLADRPPPVAQLIAVIVVVALVPPYSWSGLDFFLWDDLFGDLCKWHFLCTTR